MTRLIALLAAAAIAVALLVERWTRPDEVEWWDGHTPVRDPRDSTDDAGDGAWGGFAPGVSWGRSTSLTTNTGINRPTEGATAA